MQKHQVILLFGSFLFALSVEAHQAPPVSSASPIAEKLASCQEALAAPSVQGQWEGKTVIFDTNVLLNDPHAISKYPGATIVIPGVVLEEIDGKKHDDRLGKAARTFTRNIDELLKSGGNLRVGIPLGVGGTLKIDSRDYSYLLHDTTYDLDKADNKIVALALSYTMNVPGMGNVVLVSDDMNVRVKAASEEIISTPFEYEWVSSSVKAKEKPTYQSLKVTPAELKDFLARKIMPIPKDLKIYPNQFVMLETDNYPGTMETLARYFYDRTAPEKSGLRALMDFSKLPTPPKNIGQAMLDDVANDPTVDLVAVEAGAGTGKTHRAVNAAMNQTPGGRDVQYEGAMVTRTLVSVGKNEIGFIPGAADNKLATWYPNFSDNIKLVMRKLRIGRGGEANSESSTPNVNAPSESVRRNYGKTNKRVVEKAPKTPAPSKAKQAMNNFGGVELVEFGKIRGRSITGKYMILDEGQNTNVHEVKTWLTRAGDNSKFMIIGDPSQIDVPFLNESNNGLSVVSNLITSENLSLEERSRVAYVVLTEGVRSPLADLARKMFAWWSPSR